MDFGIIGSRPTSAMNSSRPSSAHGKRHGYVTRARDSNVDESLFGSHHQTKLNEAMNFKAPWEEPKPKPPRNTFGPDPAEKKTKKENKKGPILFWSPSCTGVSTYKRQERKSNVNNSSVNSSGYLWNSRDQSSFHHLRHTPTYVDESLFGDRLKDATFTAPWNERKKGEKKKQKPYLWDPPGTIQHNPNGVGLELSLTTKHYSDRNTKRPSTAIGLSGSRNNKGNPLPVWKP